MRRLSADWMAGRRRMRSRNIKPGFFKNELLAISDPLYSVIFAGLWCSADREGRLEDRPAKIHMEVNPGRAYETTERSLGWLTENAFILRYPVDNARYIAVLEFAKHQNPHHKEPPSRIPPPPSNLSLNGHASHESPELAPGKTEATPSSMNGESRASPSLAPVSPQAAPPMQGGETVLIPDSGFRIPDSSHLRESDAQTRNEFWEIARANYPPCAGRVNWIYAQRYFFHRLDSGVDPTVLIAGVNRYAAYVKGGGVSSTKFVLGPEKFFGDADEPWRQPWSLPKDLTKVEQDAKRQALLDEAKAVAREIGFRDPYPLESPGAYQTAVKLARDAMPRRELAIPGLDALTAKLKGAT